MPPASLTGQFGGNDPTSQLDFWEHLNAKEIASYDDTFHAILLMNDGEDRCAGYDARVDLLRSRRMLPDGFAAAAGSP